MSSDRHYRGQPSRPIPVWNGILEHFASMGMAIWLYLWCLDRITREKDGVGQVLGGTPVKIERMASELGRSDRALRRDLAKLRSRYLRLRWTPYGYVIEVLNSRKFGIWKPIDSPAKIGEAKTENGRAQTKNGQAVTENGRSKEDSAVAAVDSAVELQRAVSSKPEDLVWSFLKISPCGPISFRTLLEGRWATRNGDRPSVLIGETVDAWEVAEGQKLHRTPQLFRALAELRRKEQASGGQPPVEHLQPIRVLTAEEIPA